MTDFGALIFRQMADLNRRIGDGVATDAACETMLAETRAVLAEQLLRDDRDEAAQ